MSPSDASSLMGFSMDPNILVVGVIAGAFGSGYLLYGKTQQMAMPILCGFALMIYPFFANDLWILSGVTAFLIVLPFLLKF